jgi:hypothetical protein
VRRGIYFSSQSEITKEHKMFGFDYEAEREEALRQDSLTQGEYLAEACYEYVYLHGEQRPDLAWINTPFDSWEPNPHYDGRHGDVPHPEAEACS